MKTFLKWTGFVVGGLVGLALLGFAYLYFASERVLDHEYAVADNAMLVRPTDAGEIAEGQRGAHFASLRAGTGLGQLLSFMVSASDATREPVHVLDPANRYLST